MATDLTSSAMIVLRGTEGAFVQLHQHFAVGREALADFEAQRARHQRHRAVDIRS